MKARALRKFRDKFTGATYLPGDILEVAEQRMAEMNSGQFGKLVEVIPAEPLIPPDDKKEGVDDPGGMNEQEVKLDVPHKPPDESEQENVTQPAGGAGDQEVKTDAQPKTGKKKAKQPDPQ